MRHAKLRELLGNSLPTLVAIVLGVVFFCGALAFSLVDAPLSTLYELWRWHQRQPYPGDGRPSGNGITAWWFVARGRNDLLFEAITSTLWLCLGLLVWVFAIFRLVEQLT